MTADGFPHSFDPNRFDRADAERQFRNRAQIVELLTETANHPERCVDFPLSSYINHYASFGTPINFNGAASLVKYAGEIYGRKIDDLEYVVHNLALSTGNALAASDAATATAAVDGTTDAAAPATKSPSTGGRGRGRRRAAQLAPGDDIELKIIGGKTRPLAELSESLANLSTDMQPAGEPFESIVAQTATNRPLAYRRIAALQRRRTAASQTFGRRRLLKQTNGDEDVDFASNYAVFVNCLDVECGGIGASALTLQQHTKKHGAGEESAESALRATATGTTTTTTTPAWRPMRGDVRGRPFVVYRSAEDMRMLFGVQHEMATTGNADHKNMAEYLRAVNDILRNNDNDDTALINYKGGHQLDAILHGHCYIDDNDDDHENPAESPPPPLLQTSIDDDATTNVDSFDSGLGSSSFISDASISQQQRLSCGSTFGADDTLPIGESTRVRMSLNNEDTAALNDSSGSANDRTTSLVDDSFAIGDEQSQSILLLASSDSTMSPPLQSPTVNTTTSTCHSSTAGSDIGGDDEELQRIASALDARQPNGRHPSVDEGIGLSPLTAKIAKYSPSVQLRNLYEDLEPSQRPHSVHMRIGIEGLRSLAQIDAEFPIEMDAEMPSPPVTSTATISLPLPNAELPRLPLSSLSRSAKSSAKTPAKRLPTVRHGKLYSKLGAVQSAQSVSPVSSSAGFAGFSEAALRVAPDQKVFTGSRDEEGKSVVGVGGNADIESSRSDAPQQHTDVEMIEEQQSGDKEDVKTTQQADISSTSINQQHSLDASVFGDTGFGDADSAMLLDSSAERSSTLDPPPAAIEEPLRPSAAMPEFNHGPLDVGQRLDSENGSIHDQNDEPMDVDADAHERRTKEIDESAARTKRVDEWHASLRSILATSQQQNHFDIHEFGTHILDTVRTSPTAAGSSAAAAQPTTTFANVLAAQPRDGNGSTAKYFLAMLQLAVFGNIALDKPPAVAKGVVQMTEHSDLGIRLLSLERHAVEVEEDDEPHHRV